MKQLRRQESPYQPQTEVRGNAVRFGQWLYLSILSILVVVVCHLLFSRMYLLKGEGFVYSDNYTVAIDFDIQANDLMVKEGDRVTQAEPLFHFDSFDIRHRLASLRLQLAELETQQQADRIKLNEIEALKTATEQYAQFTGKLRNSLEALEQKKYIAKTELALDARRDFEAVQKLHQYKQDIQTLTMALHTRKSQFQQVHYQLSRIENRFNQGTAVSPVDGIVAKLNLTPGVVLKKGSPAMQIFHGPRYIYSYFDETSFISYKKGDTVLVNIADHLGYRKGKIVELLPIAHPLPDEFQPKFKPTRRNQIAVIELGEDMLNHAPLLSTAKIRKPLGLSLFM